MASRTKSKSVKELPGNLDDSDRNVQGKEYADSPRIAVSLLSNRYSQKHPLSVTGTSFSDEKIESIKARVQKAILEHKVFVSQNAYTFIRNKLKQRGWLEKLPPRNTVKSSSDSSVKDRTPAELIRFKTAKRKENNGERPLIWQLLQKTPPDLTLAMISKEVDWHSLTDDQIVSCFPSVPFNTKTGLCSVLQQLYWYGDIPQAGTFFPRCYNVYDDEERLAFINDFRLTACLGLLKWMISKYDEKGHSEHLVPASSPALPSDPKTNCTPDGKGNKIPPAAIIIALCHCMEYTRVQKHEEIDGPLGCHVEERQWKQFLSWYYLAVHDNAVISDESNLMNLCKMAKKTLQTMVPLWPQMDMDGHHNLWIIKPGDRFQGQGIQIKKQVEDILSFVNPYRKKVFRYVVQKYIECPLLIHNTKFDIRQWFLVTDWQSLTVWMYRESYLRFSSQQFSLVNMHKSIHLCNNTVQKNYTNCENRSNNLPKDNMWDSLTFQEYLRVNGYLTAWDTLIYPRMCQALISTLLASQGSLESSRRNCFELFGADFILTKDFNPWLIEINSSPSMAASTSITSGMCKQCLEDVIKVVVDWKQSHKSDTGHFEMIYCAPSIPPPVTLGVPLCVSGQQMVHGVL